MNDVTRDQRYLIPAHTKTLCVVMVDRNVSRIEERMTSVTLMKHMDMPSVLNKKN